MTNKFMTPVLRSLTTTSPRPFQILGVQQIALGSTDKSGMTKLWQDIFGLQPIGSFRSEKENVDEDILKLGAAKSPFCVEVDLMVPIDETKSPKVNLERKKGNVFAGVQQHCLYAAKKIPSSFAFPLLFL